MAARSPILVRLGPRSYPILVEEGLLPCKLARHPLLSEPHARVLIVADARLRKTARGLQQALGRRCAGRVWLRGGESTKDISSLPPLYAAAARARLDRKSLIVAIGGGVIGDVTGFFAATHLRGIRIVHVPTTLVAQVDSAIGGKTGVNLPCGKNLVGAFHQPSLVAVDPATLATLPEREFRSGLAEVIKYGIISDPVLFRRLEDRLDRVLARDAVELAWVIRRCVSIKARVVARDEREVTGLRAILNFGHTLGHGIEAAARYALLHGEAVALGMVAASRLSRERAGLPAHDLERILRLIGRAGLPLRLEKYLPATRVLAAMRLDKKAAQGRNRFVLARRLGSVVTGIPIPEPSVLRILDGLHR